MELKISKRLLTVAALVPSCNALADIGSDHGLLPLYLLQTGRIARAYCCDIRPGPLETAVKNIAACRMDGCAVPLLGNGLAPVHDIPHDCAVIAGMGGETIAQILAEDQICAQDPRLFILQPMTRANVLRHSLAQQGFGIVNFVLCEDNGRLYDCFSVRKGVPIEQDPLYLEISRPFDAYAALYTRYLMHERNRIAAVLHGMAQSASPDPDIICRMTALAESLDRLIAARL